MKTKKRTKKLVSMRLRASARIALSKLCRFYSLSQACVVERLLERELQHRSLDVLGVSLPAKKQTRNLSR